MQNNKKNIVHFVKLFNNDRTPCKHLNHGAPRSSIPLLSKNEITLNVVFYLERKVSPLVQNSTVHGNSVCSSSPCRYKLTSKYATFLYLIILLLVQKKLSQQCQKVNETKLRKPFVIPKDARSSQTNYTLPRAVRSLETRNLTFGCSQLSDKKPYLVLFEAWPRSPLSPRPREGAEHPLSSFRPAHSYTVQTRQQLTGQCIGYLGRSYCV